MPYQSLTQRSILYHMIVLKKDWSYTLEKTKPASFILTVVCGSIGIYEIKLELNFEEIKNFNNLGEPYIVQQVKKIQESPSKYAHRQINNEAC